eukprot:gene8247-10494_t
MGLWGDSTGTLFIADSGHHRIRNMSLSSGKIDTYAGSESSGFRGDGGPAVRANLNFPTSLWVDSQGNMFIADSYNNRIRRVDHATKHITTYAGYYSSGFNGDKQLATLTSLSHPSAVVGDSVGNIYFADLYNYRVRMVNATTLKVTTIAGTGTQATTGDGGLAKKAAVSYVQALALDKHKNLLIADQFGDEVRVVDLKTKIITRFAGANQTFSGDGEDAFSATLNNPQAVW